MVNIRVAREADLFPLREILSACGNFKPFEIEVAIELVRANLDGSADYMVEVAVDENDRVLGYICYGLDSMTDGTFNLYWIAVHPRSQGKGIGRLLLEHLERRVLELGGRMIVIETSSTERYKSTQNFYLKAGYTLVARIPNYYEMGDDKLIYVKELGSSNRT